MIENFSNTETPKTSSDWKKKDFDSRKDIINIELRKSSIYENFEIISVPDNGQIVFKINENINANIRGSMLLDLEEKLKNEIDLGITVWCEPVGDKSKLRNLRGIKIKT